MRLLALHGATRAKRPPLAGTTEIDASVRALVLTGNAAGLRRRPRLAGAATTFTLAGQAAILTRTRVLSMGATYTLTGYAINMGRVRSMTGALGTYTLTGQAAALKMQHKLPVTVGTLTLTGNDANVVYSNGGGRLDFSTATASGYIPII